MAPTMLMIECSPAVGAPPSHSATMSPPTPSPLVKFLSNADSHWPIFEAITRNLEPSDLINLRRVSSSLAEVYATAAKSQWNINTSLRKFFKDPIAFRNKMGELSAFISGKFALNFFDRCSPGDRLDLYIKAAHDSKWNMTMFLKDAGYASDSGAAAQLVEADETSISVWSKEGSRTRIFLHYRRADHLYMRDSSYRTEPIEEILTLGRQYCTDLSNIITSTKAYAPYACWTFKKHRSYMMTDTAPIQLAKEALHLVYEARRIIHNIRLQGQDEYDNSTTIVRNLSDGHTWSMALDGEGMAMPATSDAHVDDTQFICITQGDDERMCNRHFAYFGWVECHFQDSAYRRAGHFRRYYRNRTLAEGERASFGLFYD
ncbi:hypothetical protein BU16DRAFT_554043 [Lophium mytilinum]|uniref:F-box domain-containing protein n=1 Tax=Lophium mytilinum TaxID=390894 RepID=A0A6A6RB10_9PEZI|nr:hypothetical protein BU16DRAFT_554043 [Lophium mytilinum]